MRKVQSTLCPALIASLLLAAASCGGGGAEPADASPSSRSVAKAARVVDLAGLEQALQERRGQGFLLNFWATWCGPCVAELPELIEVAHEFRPKGGSVVGISYDLMVPDVDPATIPATVDQFLRKKALDFEVLIYEADDYDAINERFDLPGEIPVTLAIDAEGRIVDRALGKAGKERFQELMRAALGNS